MRLLAIASIALLLAFLGAGCGSSGEGTTGTPGAGTPGQGAPPGAAARSCGGAPAVEGLRATGLDCGEARRLAAGWKAAGACAAPPGASRSSCDVGPYRCAAVRAGRGLAVSCARPGRTASFIVPRTG